jgi:hypothetical protein
MDYTGNSDKSKEPVPEKKKFEKVVTGEVVDKEIGLGRKFKNVFFGGDAKQSARYVAGDVLLPALRNLIVDMATMGIERLVNGEGSRRRGRSIPTTSRVQYNAYSGMVEPRQLGRVNLPGQPPRITARAQERDLILERREDAEAVLEQLTIIIDQYEVASVSDLNELLGRPSSHIDQKWGWTSLGHVSIRQVREGYHLDLPQPEEI